MKNNDLSNQVGYVFAFRYEGFISKKRKRENVLKEIYYSIRNIPLYEIDELVVSLMRYIFRRTEYTVEVVINRENLTDKVREKLIELPISRIIEIYEEEDISLRINGGDISYYVDNDEERRSLINSEHAIDLERAWQLARRGVIG